MFSQCNVSSHIYNVDIKTIFDGECNAYMNYLHMLIQRVDSFKFHNGQKTSTFYKRGMAIVFYINILLSMFVTPDMDGNMAASCSNFEAKIASKSSNPGLPDIVWRISLQDTYSKSSTMFNNTKCFPSSDTST